MIVDDSLLEKVYVLINEVKGVSKEEIAKKLKIDIKVVEKVINQLEKGGLIYIKDGEVFAKDYKSILREFNILS